MSIYAHFSEKELEILQARAERAARLTEDGQAQDVQTVLVVHVASEKYAIAIDSITAVYENIPVVAIPSVPSYIAGIANIRGYMLVVVDLAALLESPVSENTAEDDVDHAPLVVIGDNETGLAFKVTTIDGIHTFPGSDLALVPGNLELARAAYLQGIFPDGTILLRAEAVLEDTNLIVNHA